MGVADARTVAASADEVVMIVRWDKTPAKAVEAALGTLRSDGVPVGGAIYTQVSPSAEGMGSLSYAAKYSAYYSDARVA
jgi:polysaccharide biosynthesis transport protein